MLMLQARALYLAGTGPAEIARQLSLNPLTIQGWITRRNWLSDRTMVQTIVKSQQPTEAQEAWREAGLKARADLARAVGRQAAMLAKIEVRSLAQLGNTPARQGLAAVTKTVTETCREVFGWSDQADAGAVNVPHLKRLASVVEAQVVEVQEVK